MIVLCELNLSLAWFQVHRDCNKRIYIYVEKFVDSFDMICRMLLMIVIVKDDEKKFWKDALVTKSREYGHTSGEDVCVPYVTI